MLSPSRSPALGPVAGSNPLTQFVCKCGFAAATSALFYKHVAEAGLFSVSALCRHHMCACVAVHVTECAHTNVHSRELLGAGAHACLPRCQTFPHVEGTSGSSNLNISAGNTLSGSSNLNISAGNTLSSGTTAGSPQSANIAPPSVVASKGGTALDAGGSES